MAGVNIAEAHKIDMHVSGEGTSNIEIEKIDAHVAAKGKGKINSTVQDGGRECRLEGNSWEEIWIDQVKRAHRSGKHKERKTSSVVSIYHVPEFIKKKKREAYDPLVVFLGPFHHKKHQKLTAMDEYKLQAVDEIVERMPGMSVEWLVSEVKELEKEIRDCYEDSAIECDGDTLAWIMTMDACFILQFIQTTVSDPTIIFQTERWGNVKRREIASDILKLENQIPLLVSKKIAEFVYGPEAMPALASHLIDIGGYFRGYPFSIKDENALSRLIDLIDIGPYHLLDLSRLVIGDLFSNYGKLGAESAVIVNKTCNPLDCLVLWTSLNWIKIPPCLRQSSAVDSSLVPSAEKLQRAGIRLKPTTEGKFHFQPRYFRHSTLFVPQIIVDDETEIFLRNLVAFDVCQKRKDFPINRIISDNMWVMDQLIDSTEDVKLFEKADIIKNYLGTADEVVKIFNDLCMGISYGEGFDHVFEKVNEHYKSQLIVLMTQFREEHCSKPWYIVSIVAAVLLLVMTLLQTIYTIKGYFRT